jgi:hypothetical protein
MDLPIEIAVFLHLFLTVGIVAIYLAMASPLLQFSIEADARIDAHRLYAWSNAGSLAGLSCIQRRWNHSCRCVTNGDLLALATSAAVLIHRTIAHTRRIRRNRSASNGASRGEAGDVHLRCRRRPHHRGDNAVDARPGALPLLWVSAAHRAAAVLYRAFGDLRPQRGLTAAAPVALTMACYLFFTPTLLMAPLGMVILWCGLLFVIQCGLQTRLRTLAPSAARAAPTTLALAFGGFVGSVVTGCLLPYYWDNRFAGRGDTAGGAGTIAPSWRPNRPQN